MTIPCIRSVHIFSTAKYQSLFSFSLTMYILFFSIILLLYISQSYTQECKFTWLNGTDLTGNELEFQLPLPYILDTSEPGEVLLELKTENVMKIETESGNWGSNGPYINATLTPQGRFILILTDHFLNYEQFQVDDIMCIVVEFSCAIGNTQKLDICQPITDTNNHYPEFVNAPYYYNLSMPYPKNVPIDLFGEIAARDIDLTNTKISFYLDESDPISQGFNARWLSSDSENKKIHYARLLTMTVLDYEADVTFHLFATDSGTPPNTSNTTVTILVDRPNSIPRFSKSIYIADYMNLKPENANGTIISFTQGEIFLSNGADKTVNYSFKEDSGEYQNNFKLEISPDDSTVQLILLNPPDKFFNESFVLLTLTAKKSGAEVTTVLHISLPGRSTSKTTPIPETTTPITSNPQNNDNSCACTDYNISIIVISVLLVGITTGLVSYIIVIRRQLRAIPKVAKNGISHQEERGEMKEVHRDSNGTTTVGHTRRSVAFNDIVEEIDAVRL